MSSAWPFTDDYAALDLRLDAYASRNDFVWDKEYKGYSVRSFSYPLAGTESVQVWIDPPTDDQAVVHVAFNSARDDRRHGQQTTYRFVDLETGLDDAFRVAREWKNAEC